MQESIQFIQGLQPVEPTRPFAAYLGGKRVLAKTLVPMIAAVPHKCYVEPFVGMGGVFFRRDRKPQAEVINDINREVANVFRMLQRHYQQLLDTMKWQLASRAEFERLVKTDPATLTELERASRFIYLQRQSFGGKVVGQAFGVVTTGGGRFDLTKLVPMLEAVHDRLSSVVIECLPFDKLITRYDRPHTLFYCDPPYWGCEDDYGKSIFSPADFELLRNLLLGIKGRFIMSINDAAPIRDIFADFTIKEVGLNYRISGTVTPARELIISNG